MGPSRPSKKHPPTKKAGASAKKTSAPRSTKKPANEAPTKAPTRGRQETQGESALLLVERGKELFALGRYDEACAALERASQLDPGWPAVFYLKGRAELGAGRHADAERSFSRDLEIGPPSARVYFLRHSARKALGDNRGAMADLDAALEIGPEVSFWRARAELRQSLGDIEGTMADLDAAVDANPGDPMLHDHHARIAFRLSRVERAAEDFARATALAEARGDPPNADRAAGLGLALCQLGRIDESLRAYDRAVELAPTNAIIIGDRGFARYLASQPEAALRDLDQAIALDPGCTRAFINRALVREQSGDIAGALADYRRLLELGSGVGGEIERLSAAVTRRSAG